MRSFKFPNMFSSNSSNIWKTDEYLEATKQNAKVLLKCARGELIGDPYFGLLLEKYLFDQNSLKLKDAIIDMIYTQLALFLPQIHIERKDVQIIQKKAKLICKFSGVNQIDFTNNTYQLLLYQKSEE